jgi:hypothetical protein
VTYGYSNRSAPDLSICGDESGKKILILTGASLFFIGIRITS